MLSRSNALRWNVHLEALPPRLQRKFTVDLTPQRDRREFDGISVDATLRACLQSRCSPKQVR